MPTYVAKTFFYGQEINIKVNHFVWKNYWHLLRWGIWDLYLLVHGLSMFRFYDCPFIIPKEDDDSKGPLCLSFCETDCPSFSGFEIGCPLNLSTAGTFHTTTLLIEFVLTGFRSLLMCPAFVQCPQKPQLLSPQELLSPLLQSQSFAPSA